MRGPENLPSAVVARVTGKAKRKPGERYGHVTRRGEYSYAGVTYPINSAKSGCYTLILQRLIERIEAMRAIYGRVLFVRFDLRHPEHEPTNERTSAFIKSARAHTQRRYQTPHMGFLWVREQESTKSQHYHMVLMLDGDKVRHSASLLDELREIWGRMGGTVWIPKNPFIFIDQPDLVAGAVKRGSYLAKARGKGYRPDKVRDFGCSRIKKT
ncbi:inovirus-type Gp2 protein [Aeromonas veronii]|uniref:YagK/YfjJ domain-containing protein n=1 Tax=Aeromonas veronii TaxID=654 RepID=UPI00300455FB